MDNTLKVWDLESGRELRTLTGHTNTVNGVAVTPDGSRAVSASADTHPQGLGPGERPGAAHLEGHTVGSRRGGDAGRQARRLRLDDNTLKVWDLASGQRAAHLDGPHETRSAAWR